MAAESDVPPCPHKKSNQRAIKAGQCDDGRCSVRNWKHISYSSVVCNKQSKQQTG